ncbi:MAG: taurine ABC transporter substrate-binding protein [Burkholderiales bacterium]|nr:taurine ABC transporter substrate-binding protein [Burkholderiales bacterium]MDE2454672.1 taurine ABC transporter substrate-binding protein [Burkholderiales bacterium]
MTNKRQFIGAAIVLAATLVAGGARAQQKEVTFAYQDMLDPIRTVQDTGALEKATGYKIHWRQFSGGGDVIRAMASGDIQVGEAGSSPIAAAVSQGQDIQLFWILDDIAAAEALVVRNGSGIKTIADLKGKKIATPFVSTSHYSLMVGMKLAGVDPKGVNVLNMRPPEIAAAWERGDIDGAFIWDPVLSRIKGNGKEILTSGDVGKKGYPTFDGLVVNTKWAHENPAFMVELVKLVAGADAQYRDHKAAWTADSPQVKAIAKWSKADAKEIPASMALYKYPTLEEQASAVWLGGGAAKALKSTAEFLKEQGRVQEVKADYSANVTTEWVKKAMGK